MKTLEQIKDEYAHRLGYKDWDKCINDQPCCEIEGIMDEIAKTYAAEAIKVDRYMYKECLELYVPVDKQDEANAFLSSYGCGLAKELQNKES